MSSKLKILAHTLDYLKKVWPEFKADMKGHSKMILCPYCQKQPLSARLFPVLEYKTVCLACGKTYYLPDIVRQLEPDKVNLSDDEILVHVKDFLKLDIQTDTEITQWLKFYEQNKFSLVPIQKNGKVPIETAWTTKEHKNINEWDNWLETNLNLGIRTGSVSGITVIDIDQKPIPEEIKKIMGETLIQETKKGFHLIYKFTSSLPTTVKIGDENIDIRNEGAQIVTFPSIVEGVSRKYINKAEIIEIPEELKTLILSKIKTTTKQNEQVSLELEELKPGELSLKNNNLEGCCNSTFLKLGGILRKKLNPSNTEYVLKVLNNYLLEKPMDDKAINSMCRELSKYAGFDDEELARDILSYLDIKQMASEAELEVAVMGERAKGEEKKRIGRALQYLLQEEKIIQKGREYIKLEEMGWTDTLFDAASPINFKVPYFHDYAHFNIGDLIVIGAKNKFGKTGLSMNLVKRFVDQNIKPYYIFSEGGGRYQKYALELGLKEGDFWRVPCFDPEKVILKNNSVVIYDWLMPKDFAKTDKIFNSIIEQLEKTKSFMMCFVQLKDDKDNSFFAPNLIGQFPCLLSRYLYEDENNGEFTKFTLDLTRDPKHRGKKFEIPCKYDFETKIVSTISEIEEKEKEKKSE